MIPLRLDPRQCAYKLDEGKPIIAVAARKPGR